MAWESDLVYKDVSKRTQQPDLTTQAVYETVQNRFAF